ncbi:sigma-54-dependent transcriptional regulator [Roseiconus lacunae]|uniref:sigma-54-dependent transcriptional regulator n=1 Tax=Roseiconus lacunae TaxID=2605694 RepID=UPI001E3D6800|nr:sigma-54 dependent transcriptional regulator [Roseiconus lacunae]MCD0462831.1 sigma-54 dependent transcriptional regulator [Roseiconus lacunae]
MPTVLVIDDDPSVFLLTRKALDGVADIVTAETADEGLELINRRQFDAVLLDIMLPDRNGLALYCEIKEKDRRLPVIFMTVEAASGTAIEAMQLGAFDYVAKPLSVSALRHLISRAIEQRELASVPVAIVADEELAKESGELFIGRSTPMLEVFKAIGRVSKQNVPVLVRGESGTGKELVARALFQYSHRAEGPFLAVNCAALPDTLLESELFGYEKGAFTGADSRRIGKFEQCNKGTLFLDEIGDMASIVQAKVLRVLQDQRFERIGGNNELKTDVRIVAATNRPLEEMVSENTFREDLLYRLNAVTIHLPPLRERPSDIPMLIQHFLSQAKVEFNKPDLEGASPETVEMLKGYSWPGNVRQLRAVVRRCVLDSALPVLVPEVLPNAIKEELAKSATQRPASAIDSVSTASHGNGQPSPTVAGNGSSGNGISVAGGVGDSASGIGQDSAAALAAPGSRTDAVDGMASMSNEMPFSHDDSDADEPNGLGLPALVDNLFEQKSTDMYSEVIAYAERYLLLRVLRETEGNQSKAAAILGITRGKLRDRIASYDIRLESGVRIGE